MRKLIFRTLLLLVIVLFGTGAFFWVPDGDEDKLIAKYTNEHSQFLEVEGGTRIHYRDEGVRAGPTLVFIHGNSASLHTWEPLIDELSDRFRLVSLDLPGHGLTGPSAARDYSAEASTQLLNALLDHLEINSSIFVGNSMGGWLSWRYALAYPGRIDGLVLIDSSGAVTDEPVKYYAVAKITRSKLGQIVVPRIAPKSIVRNSLTQVMWNDELVTDELVDRYRDLSLFPGNRIAMIDRTKVDREPAYWNRIDEITEPVLILWGEQDTTTPLSHGHAFHAALPNSELKTYSNTAHAPMEEVPMKVAADIRLWFDAMFAQPTSGTQ